MLIEKAAAVQIANITPLVSKNITGRGLPVVSSSVPDLALVDPNPSTASGPINLHSRPVYVNSWLIGVLNHKEPGLALAGTVALTTAAPMGFHCVPS